MKFKMRIWSAYGQRWKKQEEETKNYYKDNKKPEEQKMVEKITETDKKNQEKL